MLILGGRYGTVESKSGKSYTELEFEYAKKIGKPLFSIVIDERALDKKTRDNGLSAIEGMNGMKLASFRDEVLSFTSSFYSDTSSLKLAVMKSLSEKSRDSSLIGWIRADQVTDREALDENRKLRLELKKYEEKVADLDILANFPQLPDIKELTVISILCSVGSVATKIDVEATWEDLFSFFCSGADFNYSDYNDNYFFYMDYDRSAEGIAKAIILSQRFVDFRWAKVSINPSDLSRLEAYYIEVGLLGDGEGREPFGVMGKKLARRMKIQSRELGRRIRIVDGDMSVFIDDDIPF